MADLLAGGCDQQFSLVEVWRRVFDLFQQGLDVLQALIFDGLLGLLDELRMAFPFVAIINFQFEGVFDVAEGAGFLVVNDGLVPVAFGFGIFGLVDVDGTKIGFDPNGDCLSSL